MMPPIFALLATPETVQDRELREHGFSRWLDRGWPSRPSEPQKAWEAPRVTDGATDRRARIKALGNAVVPQVGYIVGQMIVAMETAEG